MQVRCCDTCGAILPPLDPSAPRNGIDLCATCARKQTPVTPASGLAPAPQRPPAAGASAGNTVQPLRMAENAGGVPPPSETVAFPDEIPMGEPDQPATIPVESDEPDDLTPPHDVPFVTTAPGTSTTIQQIPTPPPSSTGPLPAVAGQVPSGAMAFYFCEKCGKRVTDADLAAGRARNKQLRGYYCGACSEGALTVSFEAISEKELLKETLAEEHRRKEEQNRLPRGRRPSARLTVSNAVPAEAPARETGVPPPTRRGSSTRLVAAKVPAGSSAPGTTIQPGPERDSTGARLPVSRTSVGVSRRRSGLRGKGFQSAGVVVGSVLTVLAVVAFMLLRSNNRLTAENVAAAPSDTTARTSAHAPPAPPATTPNPPITESRTTVTARTTTASQGNGTPPTGPNGQTPEAEPAVGPAPRDPALAQPASAVPLEAGPDTPPPETGHGVVEADLSAGLERAAQLTQQNRYGDARQLINDLKIRHAGTPWWTQREKEWSAAERSFNQQLADFEDEAREVREQLQSKPTDDRVKQAVETYGPYARSDDAVSSALAVGVLQDAQAARRRLAEEERGRRRTEIETQLAAFESAVKDGKDAERQEEIAAFLTRTERYILGNPALEVFVPRLQGLSFDLRRRRDGDLMLYKAKVSPRSGGVELAFDFATDPLGVWQRGELDSTGTQSSVAWEEQTKSLVLQARGTGTAIRQKHTSTAYAVLPFDLHPQRWLMEVDVSLRETGAGSNPADFGLLIGPNVGGAVFFGVKQVTGKKGEVEWQFDADNRRPVMVAHLPLPATRTAHLQINCFDGLLGFSATVEEKPVPITYHTRLSGKFSLAGCYARTIGDVNASASFTNFRLVGLPDKEALSPRLKLERELLVNMPLDQWRESARKRLGIEAQPEDREPRNGLDETLDSILKNR